MNYVVGVDVGGTFTDCVVVDESGRIAIGKAPSVPDDFSIGVIDALRDAARNLGLADEDQIISSTRLFFHACTVGENTLITRSGARTGLLATKGFGDTMLIMRGKVAQGLSASDAAHISALTKPEAFVPRQLTGEVTERIDYKGAILVGLDATEIKGLVERLLRQGVESFAICLLWSIANDAHERLIEQIIGQCCPQAFVSRSSHVAPFLGEYERMATTVFNAYIGPKISSYLRNLHEVLRQKGCTREPLIMQAYGGVLGVDSTCRNPIGTIESGPAAGVLGSSFVGELVGRRSILATDMGGTTFKVSLIRDGVVERDYSPVLLRHTILSPKIWVESIGAGGGSIARVDRTTGLLKVGPDGAGAKPGPVCYGLGGSEPTVTDADLVLGYINEDYFLGGRLKVDKRAAVDAIQEKIAARLGMSTEEAAHAIYRITNAQMSDLVHKATVQRGHDPREFVLFAFGGAGPVHAARYAADLGIRQIVIPSTASVHGASGLISSDVVYEYGRSVHMAVPVDTRSINHHFATLCREANDDLRSAGFKDEDVAIKRAVDMRYRYQVHEITVALTGAEEVTEQAMEELCSRFDELYEMAYGQGSTYPEAGREILALRLTATGRLGKPVIRKESLAQDEPDHASKGTRDVFFEEHGCFVPTKILDFQRMQPGMEVSGPSIIETAVTTIVVPPTARAAMDEFRNVRLQL